MAARTLLLKLERAGHLRLPARRGPSPNGCRNRQQDFNITVQFCIAHLIRDIKFLTGLPDAATRAYGTRLLAAVKAMFKVIHRRGEADPPAFRRALEQARDRILDEALRDVPSRLAGNGKTGSSKQVE